jgi:hypothetical protein
MEDGKSPEEAVNYHREGGLWDNRERERERRWAGDSLML